MLVSSPAVRAEHTDRMGVVQAEDAVIGFDGLQVFGHGGDDAERGEDAVGHDQGNLAGLEAVLELQDEVFRVPVPEHDDRFPGRIHGVLDAEVGRFIDEDGVDLVPERLDEKQVVEISGNEVKGIFGPEVSRNRFFELDNDRVMTETGSRRRAVNAVFPVRGDAGLDDFGMAV